MRWSIIVTLLVIQFTILGASSEEPTEDGIELAEETNETAAKASAIPTPPKGDGEGNTPETPDGIPVTDKFWPSFCTAFLMIIVSELGDKTFLIAAIMAMKHARMTVLVAAVSALGLMTVISAAFGLLLPNLIPRSYTIWLASLLFLVFGCKMVIEGLRMSPTRMREEYDEVSHEIEDAEDAGPRRRGDTPTLRMSRTLESQPASESYCHPSLDYLVNCFQVVRVDRCLSPVFIQTFSLTFLAEWGDRSQIATIALAAAQNVYGVTVGAILGHLICTALAVISGRLLANVLSIKTVTICGGISFVAFAFLAFL